MSRIHQALVRAGAGHPDQAAQRAQDLPPFVEPASEQPEVFSEFANVPVEEVDLNSGSRISLFEDPHGPGADRFRFLRMRLRDLWTQKKLRRVLVTSPLPEEGKSTIILNLATALAEDGKRSVLLIEGDMHHPVLAGRLGLTEGPGLAGCLQHGIDPWSAVRRLNPLGWYLLNAGSAHGSVTELVQSDATSKVIQTLSPAFDWVLVDSPPVIPLTDALSLARHVQATLLVAKAGRTQAGAIAQAITLLGRENVLGIVLNGAPNAVKLYPRYYHR